jgi:hypothetical protein
MGLHIIGRWTRLAGPQVARQASTGLAEGDEGEDQSEEDGWVGVGGEACLLMDGPNIEASRSRVAWPGEVGWIRKWNSRVLRPWANGTRALWDAVLEPGDGGDIRRVWQERPKDSATEEDRDGLGLVRTGLSSQTPFLADPTALCHPRQSTVITMQVDRFHSRP